MISKKFKPAIGNEWQVLNRTDDGAIYQDKNGREAEEYNYVLNNRYAPAGEFDIYEQRRNATQPIVRAYGAEHTTVGGGLNPHNEFRVLTERIPHRLSQAPQLSYPESLYVLQESLNGYEHLYNKAGSFSVNQDMIGFTPEGETKVWFNENFGDNRPSQERRILQSTNDYRDYLKNPDYVSPVTEDESALVRNIVEVVEDKCEEGLYRDEGFRSQIYRDKVGFTEAKSIVENSIANSGYTRVNRVDLYNNVVPWRTGNQVVHHQQSHVQSRPVEVVAPVITNHYESNVRPVVIEPRVQSLPPVPVVMEQRVQSLPPVPVVTSNNVNRYTPYNAGISSNTKNTKYLFNYEQPKEYFHPNMSYNKY